MPQRLAALRPRLAEWVRRYGPAELGGMTAALLASIAARQATHSAIAAAYAAAWAETLAYAGVIVARDLIAERRASRSGRLVRDTGVVGVRLLAEFGPAGVIDTLVTRPLAMAAGVRLFGPVLGIVTGKIAADIVFYAPVIYMYERVRRHVRKSNVGR
jgi:hypothetical protein